MPESPLKRAIARLQEGMATPNMGLGPDLYALRGYDVGLLFETIKRYGGRHDWTPTPDNVERLALPVRFHIRDLQIEIELLRRQLIRAEAEARRRESIIAELRHPPR